MKATHDTITIRNRKDFMRIKYIAALAAVFAFLLIVGGASATLEPGVFDPDNTHACVSTWNSATQTLHLEKNAPTETNCAAGADVTGQEGQELTGLSFTITNGSHCGAGSVRFDVLFADDTFHIFTCQYGHHVDNENGTTTVTFSDSTPFCDFTTPNPTDCFGDGEPIAQIDILLDEQGTADVSKITVNQEVQVPVVIPPPVVTPPAPAEPQHTFLCYSHFPGSIPGVYLLGDGPGFIKAGTLFSPSAVPGHDPRGDNLGNYHLVCNVDGLKATGNVIDGSGQEYGPEFYALFQSYWHTTSNVYAVWK